MRLVVLVDGEHYPPVVRAAVGHLRARGDDVVAALFVGGGEKVRPGDLECGYGVAVVRGAEPQALLGRLVEEHRPDAVLDLSDEPVLGAPDRLRLAAVALARGVRYLGPDFELRPPPMLRLLAKPSVRVVATGKRTGKTALAAALARHARGRGFRPVIVAMGRGGPPEPEVIEAGRAPGPAELLALADAGRHAASDHLEDAVTSGVTTIGCRRVGGGLAGGVFSSNVAAGARLAQEREEDLVVLEGSGAAVPPVHAGAGLLCVPAHAPPEAVSGYLGPYRVLLADLVVVTMAEETAPAAELEAAIRGISPEVEVVRTVFRPVPLSDVSGRRVYYSCTAPPGAGPALRRHLEEAHGCEVVGMSHALADRTQLQRDLAEAPDYEVLATELKAAAVDVAVRTALGAGREVVFVDNRPVGEGLPQAFDRLLELAVGRAEGA